VSIDSKITEIVHAISVYIRMDRDWINSPRISAEYENGVEEFIQFAQRYEGRSDDEVKYRCPCVNCLNERNLNATQVREHFICDDFLRSYTIWTWHSELIDFPTISRTEYVVNSIMEERVQEDNMEDMIRGVGIEAFAPTHVYDTMSTNAETPLYVESTKFTWFSVVLRLTNLKATNGWTNKSLT